MKARKLPVRSVSFVPPVISTADPDIDKIHETVEKAIDRSEGEKSAKKPSKGAKRAPAPATGTTGGSIGNIREGYAANQATTSRTHADRPDVSPRTTRSVGSLRCLSPAVPPADHRGGGHLQPS